MSKKIAVIVGSLRKDSANLKLANHLKNTAPADLVLSIINISDLPIYNEDLDKNPPASWLRFRNDIKASEGVLFVTPEYNRSMPGVLKNALDVGSRPYGQSAWSKKPGAIISSSPGAIGGFGANHHLRQSLVFLDVPILQQPEAYISQVFGLFNEQGELINEGTIKFLGQFMDTYAAWLKTNL
jgi:chromate reductase, NAD(P)H dehydrogenase (quinone)